MTLRLPRRSTCAASSAGSASDQAIAGIDLAVGPGEIHALLGPNGAGKTTLLRTLAGLVEPTAGTVRVAGVDAAKGPRGLRGIVGFVPSSDRSAYQRISGVENLAFFARLHGMRKTRRLRPRPRRARRRRPRRPRRRSRRQLVARHAAAAVGRSRAAHRPARAADRRGDARPRSRGGRHRPRADRGAAPRRGAAVLWATQRLDELRGFAGEVTLMSDGIAAFEGTVEALAARAVPESRAATPPSSSRATSRSCRERHERRRAGRRGRASFPRSSAATGRSRSPIARSSSATRWASRRRSIVFYFIAELIDPASCRSTAAPSRAISRSSRSAS